jgi:hypothetical protein
MSIPTSLIVVLLVVAWLVVLVPMVARRREKVPQAEATGSGFRVLRRASASRRRRPRPAAKGQTVTAMTRPGESSDADQALVSVGAPGSEPEPTDAAEEWAAAQAAQRPRIARPPASAEDTVAEQHVEQHAELNDIHDRPTEELRTVGHLDESSDVTGDSFAREEPPVSAIHHAPTEADSAPSRPSIPDELSEQEWAEHAAAAPAGPAFADVQDEQLRPVPRRPGRGGFDPEAAEATRAYRYQQRRRITLILLIATIAFSVTAFLLVSWLWIGAAVSLALLVGYLSYLRRQVRIEAAIRQKRMERLQRARQIRPEYARPRRGASRAGMSAVAPGRTVVDLDDDDPGFDELEEYRQPVTYRRAAGQ